MDEIEKKLEYWDIRDALIVPIESHWQSTWEVDRKYVLKRYAQTDELARALQFSQMLESCGIPVAVFVPAIDGKFSSADGHYALMKKLEGKHTDLYESPQLAAVMGRELALLHLALAKIEALSKYRDVDLLSDWTNRIKPGIESFVENTVIEDVNLRFRTLFPKQHRQLIHRDVHLGNVLFDGDRLSGWLDFDIVQRNLRIFDICYLLAGMLVGNIDNHVKIDSWRKTKSDLVLGYCEVNPLSSEELDALPVLMVVIEFLFVNYWNEHDNTQQRDLAAELAKWLYHTL